MSRECRECKSPDIKIIGVDDASITVYCENCGKEYFIEPDGFDEGGFEWVEAMMLEENELQ